MAEIKVTKNGINIPAGFAFEWKCGRTDDNMSVVAGEFANADAIAYAITMGLKQSSSDAYAGEKDDVKAAALRDAKLAKVLSGTVGSGGGGKRADVVTQEVIATLIADAGWSAARFRKTYGSGKAAVVAYVEVCVQDAIEKQHAEPGTYDEAAIVASHLTKLYDAAAEVVEAREKRGLAITL